MTIQYDLHDLMEGSGRQWDFSTQLLKLILKADDNNKELLRLGFPEAVTLVEHWQITGEIVT